MKTPANAPPQNSHKTAKKLVKKGTKNERKPFVLAVFGRPHSGKTYAIEKAAKNSKQTVLVYNYGRKEDWRLYHVIELIELPKRPEKGEVLQFRYKDKNYNFDNFKQMFDGKKVKMIMCEDNRTQDAFFLKLASSKQLQNILLIIDDATVVLGSTLTKGLKALIGKAKHNKVDVILIAHSANVFPRSAFAFLTHLRLFATNAPPTPDKIALLPNAREVLAADAELKTAPKYTSFLFDIYENKTTKHTPK